MQIEHRRHGDYDLDFAGELVALTTAYFAAHAPHVEPFGPAARLDDLDYGWDMDGMPHVLLARSDDGEPLGSCEVDLPQWDNRTLAGFDLVVPPDHADTGAAELLIEAAEAVAAEAGRTTLIAGFWRSTSLIDVMGQRGYQVASSAAQRRLLPGKLDWASLDALLGESLARSAGYDIVEVPSPVPAEHIDGLVELQRAMNDAPLDDLALEDMWWSEDRYRRHEQALECRRIDQVKLVARRRSDGAYAGFTVVAIEQDRPHLGFQEDTAVIGVHRGHRLGMRLKIEMLRLLRDRHPDIVQIDTWNAESNDHMLAVNDGLGCFVVGRVVELQRVIG